MVVLSIDSGTSKCGLAVVSKEEGTLHREVVSINELICHVLALKKEFPIEKVVVGDRTNSKRVAQVLFTAGLLDSDDELVFIDEHLSTLEGRERYFQENRPRGLRRLIPRGLLVPREEYDDYAAVILAERYFKILER